MRRPAAWRRQRGTYAVLFALLLPVLMVFAALTIDFGYFWLVRTQLQAGADAAALAGVRELDGTRARYGQAQLVTRRYGDLHRAGDRMINLLPEDVTLGSWSFETRVFTADDGTLPPYMVNAVQAVARRSGATALDTFFARVFGRTKQNLTATAIAVGGSPRVACGFPVVLPSCLMIEHNGEVQCPGTLTFSNTNANTSGWTVFLPGAPVSTPLVEGAIANALSEACTQNASTGKVVYLANGNNLPTRSVNDINDAVAAAGAGGLFVYIPIVDLGSDCSQLIFNRTVRILGFVEAKLLGATGPPNKSITISPDCTKVDDPTAGGWYYGLPTTGVYLGR